MTEFLRGGTVPGFPSPGLSNVRDPGIRQEFIELAAQTQGWMQADHNADGTHGRSRHQSVTTAEGIQEFGRSETLGVAETIIWSPTFFSGNGAMTWPVLAAEMNNVRAARIGNLLWMGGRFFNTNVGGVANTALRFQIPYNQVPLGRGVGYLLYSDAGGAVTVGYALVDTGVTYVEFYKAAGVWTITAANNTTLVFNILFPVEDNPV